MINKQVWGIMRIYPGYHRNSDKICITTNIYSSHDFSLILTKKLLQIHAFLVHEVHLNR